MQNLDTRQLQSASPRFNSAAMREAFGPGYQSAIIFDRHIRVANGAGAATSVEARRNHPRPVKVR